MDAALTTAPDNEELLTLKKDLEEVLELTTQFIKSQLPDEKKDGMFRLLTSLMFRLYKSTNANSLTEIDLFTQNVKIPDASVLPSEKLKRNWRIGEGCLAYWLDDGQ